MKKDAPGDRERWADAWDVAAERLERMRAERLRGMTEEEARSIIVLIFSGPTPPRWSASQD